ncbi:MAG TPA: glycosyltransferase family 2 protein, partial [Minicystis sp.]|nr:glycosyltransferase family 2 protein [Minicystis sp.]
PAAMVAGFVMLASASLVLRPAAALFAALAALYAGVVALEAVRLSLRHGVGVGPKLLAIFPTMHVAHGLGFWRSLLRLVRSGIEAGEPERIGPAARA